jgi:mevalonate kinase
VGSKSYKFSAPGSLMLFGEHAVLHGELAVVVAVKHYIHVKLIPIPNSVSDRKVRIISQEFGEYVAKLDNLIIEKPYAYALAAIKQYLPSISQGFCLQITAEFPAKIGFGSSAAVTVAVIGALLLWLEKKPPELIKLYKLAVKAIRLVYGVGSGADVAASVFGGVIAYRIKPLRMQKIANSLPLVAIYSGDKIPTYRVIALVKEKSDKFKLIYKKIYQLIGQCSKEAIKAIKKKDYIRLGQLMNIQYGLQDSLGVNNSVLSEIVFALRAEKNIFGAKISGAGLGDCVIGLGKITKNKKYLNIL